MWLGFIWLLAVYAVCLWKAARWLLDDLNKPEDRS